MEIEIEENIDMSTGKALATNAPGAAAACPNAASAPAAGATPTRSALIMEGGAMRGMFTCGVMDVLMENGIRFDGGSGISACVTVKAASAIGSSPVPAA